MYVQKTRRSQSNAIELRLANELIKINQTQSFDWFSIDQINRTITETIEFSKLFPE